MSTRLTTKFFSFLEKHLQIDSSERLKLILSAATFFFIIGSYSILRSFKTSIFLGFVGREYEPISKILSVFFTIPAMMLHSKITDTFKRQYVVFSFLGFYACATLIFAFLFAHPVYGIPNTQTSSSRITGWAFEICMDLFQALIVGTFWSFINSITTPGIAKKSYGFIVAGSRIGGISTTFISWILIEKIAYPGHIIIPLLTGSTALLLILAMCCISIIIKKIPADHLRGYEAAYTADIKQEASKERTSLFEGLKQMLAQPYVLGIFGLVFSYEVINIIFDYQMHVLMSIEAHNQVTAMSSFMLLYTCAFQFLSFFFALFGTSTLLKHFGVQASLILMPIITLAMALLPVFYPKLIIIFIVMVVLRALNYGINHPLREILFIPTTKDIRFKSKAWIESFGRTASKTTGSTFNALTTYFSSAYICLVAGSGISIVVACAWAFLAMLTGRKYTTTIESNKVIGQK